MAVLAILDSVVHRLGRLGHQILESVHDLVHPSGFGFHRLSHSDGVLVECVVGRFHPLVEIHHVGVQSRDSVQHVVLHDFQSLGQVAHVLCGQQLTRVDGGHHLVSRVLDDHAQRTDAFLDFTNKVVLSLEHVSLLAFDFVFEVADHGFQESFLVELSSDAFGHLAFEFAFETFHEALEVLVVAEDFLHAHLLELLLLFFGADDFFDELFLLFAHPLVDVIFALEHQRGQTVHLGRQIFEEPHAGFLLSGEPVLERLQLRRQVLGLSRRLLLDVQGIHVVIQQVPVVFGQVGHTSLQLGVLVAHLLQLLLHLGDAGRHHLHGVGLSVRHQLDRVGVPVLFVHVVGPQCGLSLLELSESIQELERAFFDDLQDAALHVAFQVDDFCFEVSHAQVHVERVVVKVHVAHLGSADVEVALRTAPDSVSVTLPCIGIAEGGTVGFQTTWEGRQVVCRRCYRFCVDHLHSCRHDRVVHRPVEEVVLSHCVVVSNCSGSLL